MTMYFSHLSNVNVGVITTIWSAQSLIAAIIDCIYYKQMLGLHHVIGMILLILGSVSIGYSGIYKNVDARLHLPNSSPEKPNDHMAFHPVLFDTKCPTWIAILWGFITPCFFLAQSFYTKFITQPKYNFDAKTASFGTSSVTSFFVIYLGVIWYWRSVKPFDCTLFLYGIAGSILDNIGKSFIQSAFSNGPAGPVTAIVEMDNIILVIFDAIRTWSLPSGLEILGFILGIIGALCFAFED